MIEEGRKEVRRTGGKKQLPEGSKRALFEYKSLIIEDLTILKMGSKLSAQTAAPEDEAIYIGGRKKEIIFKKESYFTCLQ